MSTRITAAARLSATCRQQLREQLSLDLDPADELGRVSALMESAQITLPDLQQLVSTPTVSSVLGTLAPAEFSEVSSLLTGARHLNPLDLASSVQAGLAEAIAVADAKVTATARDITADVFAESGLDLGYTVSVCQAEAATGLELRREHEVVLVRVHDGGDVEFDHAGLFDAACTDRQLELEQAAERRGIVLTQRNQHYHGAPRGGALIAAAAASGDPSLARATALAASQPAQQASARRRNTRTARASQRRRARAAQHKRTQ
jgi:hypothetical protein